MYSYGTGVVQSVLRSIFIAPSGMGPEYHQFPKNSTRSAQHNRDLGLFVDLLKISGCLYTLGKMPSPTALLTIRATFLWFTGLRPVSFLCLIRP